MKKSEAYWEVQAKKLQEKLESSKPLTDESIMSFGKYKGKPLKDVPADYLVWLYTDTDLVEKQRLFKYIDSDLPLIMGQAHGARK